MSKAILWFRNDLRLTDQPALNAALRKYKAILPVYILDERLLQPDRWGFTRMGPYRLNFLLESLEDLRDDLKEKGSDLLVKVGIPETVIPELAKAHDCTAVFASHEYTHEELQTEAKLASHLPLHLYHSQLLFNPEDLPFAVEQTPDIFTQFRKRVEKYADVPLPLDPPEKVAPVPFEAEALPTLENLGYPTPVQDDRGVLAFKGGALAAYSRLDHYLWETDALASYKQTRNGLIGADYSSKFSAWLANGSISARAIWHEVEAYEAERTKNKDTYWMKFELLWREYFKYVAMRYGRKIFFKGGIQDKSVRWKNSPKALHKWITGTTGDDFVDANMRELLYTGFMSNRGRQNVASYLVHQLKQDWRKGAAWFESLLVDYDVASNYGNWMYAGGVGNDPRDRVFNTQKQARDYDKDGAFRRLWLHEDERDPEEVIAQLGVLQAEHF
ncbi:DASH family cryptochrome [Phaeodactylibacter xiamenensis]|uniref:DASH family cryptochrome n=1 Tax=Phaeodactylibacter xiamenensis TaxID=1524460 RepID=UPI003BAA2037